MSDVPDMWRIELLHPMIVHFPLALLSVGSLVWIVGRLVHREGRWGFLAPSARLMLAIGTVTVWVAIYTGDLADAAVARQLCDPRVAETHEEYALIVAAIYTAAVGIDLFALWRLKEKVWRRGSAVVVGSALIVSTALLMYVGHLGASLVYQQAAAVYQPDPLCVEFE